MASFLGLTLLITVRFARNVIGEGDPMELLCLVEPCRCRQGHLSILY
jgi:hypothetical protein